MQEGTAGEHLSVLVFDIAGQQYGVAAAEVREIVRAVLPARLPSAPPVVAGVFNLRGEVVPLVDLRARFGIPTSSLSPRDVFVVVASAGRTIALRADQALGLLRVSTASIVPMDRSVPRERHARGTLPLPDGLLLICDVARFLDEAERVTLDRALARAAAEEAAP